MLWNGIVHFHSTQLKDLAIMTMEKLIRYRQRRTKIEKGYATIVNTSRDIFLNRFSFISFPVR
jgi:hypothetical protein